MYIGIFYENVVIMYTFLRNFPFVVNYMLQRSFQIIKESSMVTSTNHVNIVLGARSGKLMWKEGS